MPKKYQKGATIKLLTSLVMELEAGRYVYLNDKPLHCGFIISMQFKSVLDRLNQGRFAVAIKR